MTNEAKVGAFTLLGIALLGFILVHLSGFRLGGDKDYTLYVSFSQVMGLNPSAAVRFAGVGVGKVKSIKSDGMGVTVMLKVDPEIKIPRGSKITIASSGFMGEKFVSILPSEDIGDYLQPDEHVAGVGGEGMDSMLESVGKAVDQVHELLGTLNDVLGNPRMKESFIATSENMRDMTANMRDLTSTLSRMALRNETDIDAAVHNLSLMSSSLMQASNDVEAMVHDFSGDGQTAANLRLAIANIAATSQRIDHMASSLEGVVTNPQTAEDLQVTLHNARQVSEKANKMMTGFGGAHMEAGVNTMYSGKADRWTADFDMHLYNSPDSFLLLGIDDIGEGNRFNGQVGMRRGALTGRAGIVDSKLGVGVDAAAGSRWVFSADAYNINDAALKVRATYKITSDTYLIGQINDVNRSDRRTAYVGLRHTF